MTEPTRADRPELTAEIVFARLEELRAVLRLNEYLRQLRPVARPPDPPPRR
ncbi:MAG: hypothetical protein M3Y87_16075 [Myxococcota bacterium]|nr:hypothetical protein [Myxococcota bacterium]